MSGLRPMLLELPQQFNGGGINSTLTLDVSVLRRLPGQRCVSQCAPEGGRCPGKDDEPFILSFIVEALP